MRIFDSEYTRAELMRRVGGLGQIGGVEMVAYQEGHSRGVRSIEFRTGTGFRFGVLPDRGLDIGPAEFQGLSLAWMSPKTFPGPWYYESAQGDPYSFVRVALGGLFNTGGLVTMGAVMTIPTDHYGYAQRPSDTYGIHGRISMTPADKVNFGETWKEDECVLWAEGTAREYLAYGENVSLTRRYESALGSSSVTIRDIVRNDGYYPSPHQFIYHFNIGFPIVDSTSELLCTPAKDPDSLGWLSQFDKGVAEKEKFCDYVPPQPNFGCEAYGVEMQPDADGWVSVALVNRRLRPEIGGIGVYVRYPHKQLPHYVAWRQMAEGLYAVGLEPASNPFGTPQELLEEGYQAMLQPGEERFYDLEFGVLAGRDQIESFAETLPKRTS